LTPSNPSPTDESAARPTDASAHPDRRIVMWLFVLMAATFLLVQEGGVNNYDGRTMYEVTESMVERGTFAISSEWNTLPGRGGLEYGRYGLGLSLVSVVPYVLSWPVAHLSGHTNFVTSAAASLVSPIIAASLIIALYALSRRMGAEIKAALVVAIGAVIGTFMLPYTKEFFSEPLATLCLVVAIERFLARRPGIAGFAMGAAILTRPQTLLFAPVLLLVAWRRDGIRPSLAIIGGLVPGVLATLAYNIVRFGDPLSFGYEDVGFTTPFVVGARGLLLEPSKSVLLFAPIVVLLPVALWHLRRRNGPAFVLVTANLAITFVVTATWFAWHGGWSWGPRLLIPGLIPALAAIGPWLSEPRRLRTAAFLLGLGFVVSLPALIVSPGAQTLEVRPPPPETHFLDTQPLSSPSVLRQLELIPKKAAYSVAHPYEDRPDGMNHLRTLSLWQLGTMRVLGTPGLFVSVAGTTLLLAIAVMGYRRLHSAILEAVETHASMKHQGNDRLEDGYPGASNLETMAVAQNYNRFLTSTILARVDPSWPVLDFGAGNGMHARELRARGLDVRCVEPDARLRGRLDDEGFQATRDALEFGREVFGSVYSLNVLEHIEDDAAALHDLFTVTRPGGHLILYVPAFPILFSAMDREVGHVRRYRKEPLRALVHSSGFRVTRCEHVDSLGFVATLMYRLVSGTGSLRSRSVERYDRFVFPLSRAVDRLAASWIGKNLLLEARRD
jgi:SAM-dependent methyltransferase